MSKLLAVGTVALRIALCCPRLFWAALGCSALLLVPWLLRDAASVGLSWAAILGWGRGRQTTGVEIYCRPSASKCVYLMAAGNYSDQYFHKLVAAHCTRATKARCCAELKKPQPLRNRSPIKKKDKKKLRPSASKCVHLLAAEKYAPRPVEICVLPCR